MCVPLIILIWGSFIEPHILTVRRFIVGTGKNTMRIVFISDIHVGPYKGARWVKRLVRKTNALKPDLILLGGDFTYEDASDPSSLSGFIELRARYGVMGIMGNHDFSSHHENKIQTVLENANVVMLRNMSKGFMHKGIHCVVTGVEDDWEGDTDFEKANKDIKKEDCVIALIHNPDLAPHAAKFHPALMLSGHVHGGQIRLPFMGAIAPLPHHLGRKFDRGQFNVSNTPLIIGQGVGESGPRARLFCPPQIVQIELRHSEVVL